MKIGVLSDTHGISKLQGRQLAVLVFGHSHQPECRWVGSTLLLNPGSPTDPRLAPVPTVGIQTLGDVVFGEIINLS